jgi:hypothetical protein
MSLIALGMIKVTLTISCSAAESEWWEVASSRVVWQQNSRVCSFPVGERGVIPTTGVSSRGARRVYSALMHWSYLSVPTVFFHRSPPLDQRQVNLVRAASSSLRLVRISQSDEIPPTPCRALRPQVVNRVESLANLHPAVPLLVVNSPDPRARPDEMCGQTYVHPPPKCATDCNAVITLIRLDGAQSTMLLLPNKLAGRSP